MCGNTIDLLGLVCDGVVPNYYKKGEYAASKLGVSFDWLDELFFAYGYVSACANGGRVTPEMVADKIDAYLAGKLQLPENIPTDEERRRCGDWLLKFMRGEVKYSVGWETGRSSRWLQRGEGA